MVEEQNASKQGNFDSFAAIFLFMFSLCMWGLGSQKDSPISGVRCRDTKRGELGAFLLTVKLLCLQSLKALIRRTSHCEQKSSNCEQKAEIVSEKAATVTKKAEIVNCK